METTLQLSQPAFLKLQSAEGKECRIDVYEARRLLDDAGRQPTEAMRQAHVLKYVADKLQVDRESLAENMALEFNDTIVRIIERLNSERQKKTASIAGWPPLIQASQATSALGP